MWGHAGTYSICPHVSVAQFVPDDADGDSDVPVHEWPRKLVWAESFGGFFSVEAIGLHSFSRSGGQGSTAPLPGKDDPGR